MDVVTVSMDTLEKLIRKAVADALKGHSATSSAKALMNATELAEYLGISRRTLYTWEKEGRLPARFGNVWKRTEIVAKFPKN